MQNGILDSPTYTASPPYPHLPRTPPSYAKDRLIKTGTVQASLFADSRLHRAPLLPLHA